MAVKHVLVSGDTHGRVIDRIAEINGEKYPPTETALIILGDFGTNFYLNNTDKKNKKNIQNTGYIIYCVRGNHEERPENIPGMIAWYDADIQGSVYIEPEYPNIRYLMDGHSYSFNGHSALVIGGAYSVDKWYRLSRAHPGDSWTGWFKDEQLTVDEMQYISDQFQGQYFDFVLSHTCPKSWQPVDLFHSAVDQNTVDNTMEQWLDQLKDEIDWAIWLFGHYHSDRLIRPGVEMYYSNIEELSTIWERWQHPDELDQGL